MKSILKVALALTLSAAVSAQTVPGLAPAAQEVIPAPTIALPALGTVGSLSPPPGLNGIQGRNVTILTFDTECTLASGRISGNGTFEGTGLFVGEGTFTSSNDSNPAIFTLVNATFEGDASEGCQGSGQFSTRDPLGTLAGGGTATGDGVFHFPEGLLNGSGTFQGHQLFFANGTGTLTSVQGYLSGPGNASGPAILCKGQGVMQGKGSFSGSGSFVGQGYFFAKLPRAAEQAGNIPKGPELGTFVGSGLLEGDGFCGKGDAVELAFGDEGPAGIADIIDFGDSVYVATLAAQAYAVQAKAPEPAPAAGSDATASAG